MASEHEDKIGQLLSEFELNLDTLPRSEKSKKVYFRNLYDKFKKKATKFIELVETTGLKCEITTKNKKTEGTESGILVVNIEETDDDFELGCMQDRLQVKIRQIEQDIETYKNTLKERTTLCLADLPKPLLKEDDQCLKELLLERIDMV